MYDIIAEGSAEEAAAAYSQLLNGEDVRGLEVEFADRSGDVVTLEVNATPLTEGDEIVGVQGVGRDITARKEREKELEMKTRAMDEAEVGISIADPNRPDEPLIYVNEGFERVTGYSADEAIGRNCRFLQGEETAPAATAQFRDAIETETATTVELINYRNDGIPFWNRVQLNPVFDDEGDLLHYIGFQNDITERKRTEQLIRLLNRVLRHNLRNDMNKITGWAHSIRTGELDDNRDAGSRIERISENLTHLSKHARELENYARGDRRPRRLDPVALLGDLTQAHSVQFPDAEITANVDSDRDICSGPELEAALSELLTNAVKHNPKSHPRAEITVRDDDEWTEVVITDNGPGIDETESQVVTAGNETALEHASGLGLWLVNWIVTRYGGSFQISSRGENDTDGTIAIVRLPAIGPAQQIDDVDKGPTVLFR
jgi:PAS domain S-box-containing protein